MKLIINAETEREVTVNIGGRLLEIEVTNVPEDRQWKIDALRSERDGANAVLTDTLRTLDAANVTIADLRKAAVPMNKILAIKKAREMTSLSLKEAKDLVDAIFIAAATPWQRW